MRAGDRHDGLGTGKSGEIGHLQGEPGRSDAHDQQMHKLLAALDQRLLKGQVKRPLQVLELQYDVGLDQFGASHRRNSEAQRSMRVLRLKPPPNSRTRAGSSCASSIEAF